MDSFLVVTTTADGREANRMCDTLEKAGVAVLLERVEVRHKDAEACGYRLLVPSKHVSFAMSVCRGPSGVTGKR